ncbi:alcohol acetyltransferase-domain-containing protein [Ilyonectria destructans]|nr:alcohol acetyltransferase-domain-containing protein [Ilyonectria destructans]
MANQGSAPSPKAQIIRRLGPFECFQSALFTLDLYCGTSVICRYGIPENLRDRSLHEKLVEFFENAVADTIIQHPLLQVGLTDRDTKRPAWIQLDHIDLSKQIEWRVIDESEKHDAIFKKTLQEQLDTKYESPETRPSWRIIVSRLDAELLEVMFVWSHLITDGTGGKIFHETLFQSLNKVRDETSESICVNHLVKPTATPQNLPPPQDSICNFTISPVYAVFLLWNEFKPKMFTPTLAPHKLRAPIHLTPTGTQSRRLCIDNVTLQNVLVACRAHKTTLTGLLHGICLVSLVSLLKDETPATLYSETPLNLRRFIPSGPPGYPEFEPSKTIGNYVSKMDHVHDQALVTKVRDLARGGSTESERIAALEDVMWSVSTTVREELQGKLDLNLKNELCGLMKLVGDYRDYFKGQMTKPRHSSWLVSNLGVIDGGLPSAASPDKQQDWTMERAYFALGANTMGSTLTISPLAVKNGPLMIGVSWQNETVDVSLGEGAVAGLETWLNHIGSRK